MKNNKCPQCGAPKDPNASQCKYYGENFATTSQPEHLVQNNPTPNYVQPMYPNQQFQQPIQQMQMNGIQPYWPIRSKVVAGLLGIFFGWLGIHKFYLGKTGSGILYLVFFWTYIPALVGFIEGIVYLASNDHKFQMRNQVRLKDYVNYQQLH